MMRHGRDIAGRKAIVTGAASGIGAATVARLIADGCSVLAVDREGHGLAGTHNLVVDVRDSAAIATEARVKLGGCDILVNNAGICMPGPLEEADQQVWDDTLSINATAVMALTRACLPMLKESSAGRVINTGSILSRFGDAGLVAYAASKHAVLGLSRALAMELGPYGITVNCVQPGAIETGMTRGMFAASPDSKSYYAGRSALGRIGQPEDIADVIVFLASDDARFLTGQGLLVDGGVMTHS
jgi:NAD(P)-dependent dehydrogenase (short-subunit alcohol dehydrogenase family)